MQELASTRGTKISVYAALDERRRLWLHVDAVTWLIQYIRDEKESGGLAPVEDVSSAVSETKPSSRIYWNFRDDNWTARAKASDGSWLQISRGVKRRQKQDHLDFQTAKQAVFNSMEAWVAAVDAGDISKAEPEDPD